MKRNTLYIVLLSLFIVLVLLFKFMSPHKFSWKPTYDKNSKEPFGCYVFDDIVSSSVYDYSVVNKTFYQIIKEDSTISRRSFLLTEDLLLFDETDIEYLYKLIHLGNQIMICSEDYPQILKDTLNFNVEYDKFFSFFGYLNNEAFVRDSIFLGTDTPNPEHKFEVYPRLRPTNLTEGKVIHRYLSDSVPFGLNSFDTDGHFSDNKYISNNQPLASINCDSMKILAWNNKNKPLAIRMYIGKGELFIISTPLMFTNYGMLDRNNASYAFRLLSYMKNKPLIRIESYGKHSNIRKTPLQYILSEASLQWATYFIMVLIISFIFFSAKRRQRIIPVINIPTNRSIEFMQLISNLYYQKQDDKQNDLEILKIRYNYFCTEVKNLTGIDLRKNTQTESDYRQLIKKTNLDIDFIPDTLKGIQKSLSQPGASSVRLSIHVNRINRILENLRDKENYDIKRKKHIKTMKKLTIK